MKFPLRLLAYAAGLELLAIAICPSRVMGQSAGAGEAEALRCRERIETVRRELLGKYVDALADLQLTLQKAADLEGALAVRSERTRVLDEQALSDKHFQAEPKALRALQVQTLSRLQDLIAQLVGDSVPKLLDLKRQLTIAGKLDEAVAVRSSLVELQNEFVPATRIANGALVSAEAIIASYAADRTRADKIYRGQTVVVRGTVAGFRPDPVDPKGYQIFLTGGSVGGWIQASFTSAEYRFREEKVGLAGSLLLIVAKDGETSRIQKGTVVELRGTCEGWSDSVLLGRCELAK